MRKLFAFSVSFILLAAVVWLTAPLSEPTKARVRVVGSAAMVPLFVEIAKRYEMSHEQLGIDVEPGNLGHGIAAVRQGSAHIAMVAHFPKEDEADLQWHLLALDGVAVVVHQNNPLTGLTREQLRKVYRGEISNWKQLGWLDAPITVVHQATGSTNLDVFLTYSRLQSDDVKAHVIIGDNQEGIQTVASNANAIAYVSLAHAAQEARLGSPIRLLNLGQQAATPSNVRAGNYPMPLNLYLVTRKPTRRLLKPVIAFAQSETNHDLIESHSLVPLQR